MKITLTINKKTPVHITFQVFVNGALSGLLVLRNEEFEQFCEILQPDIIRDDEYRPKQKIDCEKHGVSETDNGRCPLCEQVSLNPING
jgi:hypothetical protein